MKIKKIIALLFVLFLSHTISYCSQGQSEQNPLFFEVVTMDWKNYSQELDDSSRNVNLFLKKEDEGLVLCLHDKAGWGKDSYLPLLLPAAYKLCNAIEKNKLSTEAKRFIVFDVNTKDKSFPILCDLNTNVEENKKVFNEFVDWVRPLSASIHLSDSVVRSNSINIEPEPEETFSDFNPNTDLTQTLFPKSLEGMPETDVLKIENFQLKKMILRLNEEFVDLQKKHKVIEEAEEILKKDREHIEILNKRRNENIFMIFVLLVIAGFSLHKATA